MTLRILPWPRFRFAILLALIYGFMQVGTPSAVPVATLRMLAVATVAVLAFTIVERRPKQLPAWLARWAVQLAAVIITIPFSTIFVLGLTGWGRFGSGMADAAHKQVFFSLFGTSLFFAPWITFGAIVRQREQQAREQAVRFQLEKAELERKAADTRLNLLQAQVQPHFLFNTLANIRALVKAGSPDAPAVLDSLIAYLRASMPAISGTDSTVGKELERVRAYLELMHMRMPDRLRYSVHADDAALKLRCPPVTILTLVENSVRHGIDPSEEGGHIDVSVQLHGGRCLVRVLDTGVGMEDGPHGGGTGLETLRERIRLAFGEGGLRVSGVLPHGVCVEAEFPAQEAAAS